MQLLENGSQVLQKECITVYATKLVYCFPENVFNDILWDRLLFMKNGSSQSSGRSEFNIFISNRISISNRRRTEEYCRTCV